MTTFKQFLEKEVASQFTKMIMPNFEAKILQKFS